MKLRRSPAETGLLILRSRTRSGRIGIPAYTVHGSNAYSGGTKLVDIRKVNYVILGGDNAGEHLFM